MFWRTSSLAFLTGAKKSTFLDFNQSFQNVSSAFSPILRVFVISSRIAGVVSFPEQMLISESLSWNGFLHCLRTSQARSADLFRNSIFDFPKSFGFWLVLEHLKSFLNITTHWATQWPVYVHLWTVPCEVLKPDIPPWHFCAWFKVFSMHWSKATLLKELFVLRTKKLMFLKVNIMYLKIRNFDIKKLMILSAKSDINWRNQFWWNPNSNKHSEINSVSTIKF